MPAVARRLAEEFGFQAQLADPDLAVAKGAALYVHKKQLERLVQEATSKGVDLRQALADAAGEHGMTSDAVKQVVDKRVVNVVSRGFGVLAKQDEVLTSVFLVHRNDPVPIEVDEVFYTMVDDQTHVRVQVIEQAGAEESPDPADATVLVRGEISDLPPGYPEGTELRVRMAMGGDGIPTITAHHAGLKKPLELQVDTTQAMSAEEIAAEAEAVSLLKKKL